MLRSLILYLSTAEWMRGIMMNWGIAKRVARRFVAGETLDEAVIAIKQLNEKGIYATLDQLGEDTNTPDDAKQTAADIMKIADAIHQNGLGSGISLKLTQIGLRLDTDLCFENLKDIVSYANQFGIFVRVDMEDTPFTDVTIDIYNRVRASGLDNVGMVVQSYLYRTMDDTKKMLETGTRIRLVKGAYKEPAELAFPAKADVDAEFDKLTKVLIDESLKESAPALSDDGRWPPIPALGTHDEARIEYGKAYANEVGLPKNKLEIQMLYGIRRNLQEQLSAEGYPMRVYVPFGEQWYPYFMRRLAERPANLWFFISSFIRG